MAFFPSSRWSRVAAMLATCVSLSAGAMLGYSAATPAPGASRGADSAAAELARGQALYRQGKFTDAQAAADRALAIDPKNDEARLLKQAIQQHLAAAATATAPATTTITLLTPAQVSAIRLAELHEGDTHLMGTIDRPTLIQFWNDVVKTEPGADTSQQAENAFLNPENFGQQVAAIRASGLQKYIDKIQLRSDPSDMVLFRTRVHPYVLENCATAACHAAPTAKFRLLRPAGTSVSDEILYTNFYILSTYTHGEDKMINRDVPRKSLLLQYGLPKSTAAIPHPGKIEIHHFPSEDSPDFQLMAQWIRSLTFPTPVYKLPPGKTTATTGKSATGGAAKTTAPAR